MSEKVDHGDSSPFAKVHGHKAEHLENASLESGHGTAVNPTGQGAMIRPARSFSVEEEKKLYRKVSSAQESVLHYTTQPRLVSWCCDKRAGTPDN